MEVPRDMRRRESFVAPVTADIMQSRQSHAACCGSARSENGTAPRDDVTFRNGNSGREVPPGDRVLPSPGSVARWTRFRWQPGSVTRHQTCRAYK